MKRHRLARRSTSLALLVAVFATAAFATAKAAPLPIVWGSPQTVSGDSDVDTTGALVYAFTFGGTASAPPSATVNGVTFAPFAIPGGIVTSATVGNVTISESPGRLLAFNTFGSGSAPFSSLSSSYQSLLGTGAYADSPLNITISLNGLTSGQQYRLQWWTNDSAKRTGAFGGTFSNTMATSGTSSVTLDANTTDLVGGVGQFVIGTFTAAGTTQAFTLSEPSFGQNPLINALQVRAVPEPSTYALALAGIACGGFSMWRRRKRA